MSRIVMTSTTTTIVWSDKDGYPGDPGGEGQDVFPRALRGILCRPHQGACSRGNSHALILTRRNCRWSSSSNSTSSRTGRTAVLRMASGLVRQLSFSAQFELFQLAGMIKQLRTQMADMAVIDMSITSIRPDHKLHIQHQLHHHNHIPNINIGSKPIDLITKQSSTSRQLILSPISLPHLTCLKFKLNQNLSKLTQDGPTNQPTNQPTDQSISQSSSAGVKYCMNCGKTNLLFSPVNQADCGGFHNAIHEYRSSSWWWWSWW